MYSKKYYIIILLLFSFSGLIFFNNIKLSAKRVREKIIIGKVEKGLNNRPVIVEKWWSRSRRSNIVYGKLSKQVKANLGKKLKVKAYIYLNKNDSPWKRKIKVLEIIEISEIKSRTKRPMLKRSEKK